MAAKWLIPALTYLCFVRGQSPCATPDGKSGECKSILDCDTLRSIANKPGVTKEQIEFLKKSACGFENTLPKVCCPTAPSCFTPENKAGQCVDIFNCEHIKQKLSSPSVTQQDKIYVNSLRCQGPAPFSVCCGPPPGPSPGPAPTPTSDTPALEGECVATAELPDPSGDCCGQDGSSNKINGGTATAIDQYPWLALIEYRKDNKIKLLCGGVLISGRYVLTAGHCVLGTVLNAGEPVNVRLGEYDTSNSGKDCVEVEGGEPGTVDCTVEPVIIPIERVIPHPEYNPRNSLRRNDIAMLRLKHIARYTDFVRPICLPAVDVTANMPSIGKLFAAGWGAVNEKISSSNVKLHVDLPFKGFEECQRAYSVPNRKIKLWERQVCAGGELGKDSCKGDSGGPLMYSDGSHFDVVGIVSFGPVPCGLLDVPGVYTKVFEYKSWISSNIQP